MASLGMKGQGEDRAYLGEPGGRWNCVCVTSLIAQLVKNPSAMQEAPVQFLGREDLLEKG